MSSLRRRRKNNPDNFCYICGQYTPPVHCKKFTPKKILLTSFTLGVKLETRTRNGLLTYAALLQCLLHIAGKKKKMSFGVPMIRREQAGHSMDCYFCLTNIKGFSRESKSKIKHPNCRSAMNPIQHSSTVPIPSPPLIGDLGQDASSSQSQVFSSSHLISSSSEASVCEMFIEENEPNSPILINKHMLNNLSEICM